MKRIAAALCLLLAVSFLTACTADTAQNTTTTTYPQADKLIALTFDDGPDAHMGMIMDVLAEYDAKATFFVIGNKINDQTASVIQRAHDQGHEIGNHGFEHADLTGMSADELQNDVAKTQKAVADIIGVEPVWMRPPFLATSLATYLLIDMPHAGMAISAKDGSNANTAQERYELIVSGAYDGAIALLHCNSITADILPQILTALRQQGYEFVTVSQLFARVDKVPEKGANIMYADNRS